MIELALPVIPSADHGLDFAGSRIQRNECHLRLRNRIGTSLLRRFTAPFVILLREQQIYVLHARVHRCCGCALQGGIERRIDAEIFAEQFVFRILVEQVVFHHVDEVRRVPA